jgi:hypothetical protein
VERILDWVGSAAHGGVTREHLLQEGVTANEIRSRLEIGTLIREHRGVYRVGHRAPSVGARYLAAVFACGKGALLCGRAAAYIQGSDQGRAASTGGAGDGRAAAARRDYPSSATYRGCDDVAPDPHHDRSKDARRHRQQLGYGTTPRHVEAVLARRPNAPGAGKLRRIISGDTPLILSKLEKGCLRRLRGDRRPLPKTNRHAGAHYVDCRWPEHKLPVELDTYRFHSSRYAWEQDYRRERDARARGDEFRRYTWTDVFEEPDPMLADLRRLIGCAGSSTA